MVSCEIKVYFILIAILGNAMIGNYIVSQKYGEKKLYQKMWISVFCQILLKLEFEP